MRQLHGWRLSGPQYINSRPLTYVPLSNEDEIPSTPNTFSNAEVRIPASMAECDDNIRIQWKITQKMAYT